MMNEIALKILLPILNFIITGVLGYSIAKIKNYKKEEQIQQEALKCLLRSQITSKYYVYSELGEIPSYEKENINYMFEQYTKMGGNSYVAKIMQEINLLPIKK